MLKLFVLLALTNSCLTSHYYDDVLELIRNSGYKGNAYKVKTSDGGWILKVHRIYPKYGSPGRKFPVFLMHGLFATSADYIVTGRTKALAYLLADNGYDVWMGNARANRHAIIDKSTANYKKLWKFSFHEIGFYDLPVMIDCMLNMTGAHKAFYVGHSQGTSALLVMLSTRPEYNEKLVQAHLLAPVAFIKYFPNKIIKAIAQPAYELVVTNKIDYLDISSVLTFGSTLGKILCNQNISPGTTLLCKGFIYAIVGVNTYQEELDEVILFISKFSVKCFKIYLLTISTRECSEKKFFLCNSQHLVDNSVY
jgi:lysosomal acid lipase/cholesteryl ester hydrolase